MAEKYLPLLIKKGLIVRVDGEQGVLYKITEKGREVLRDFKRIMGSA
jgi:predicted transcriptional regulator